ncbi:MAG: hypothetical protein H0T42_22520 [Deltaproteobacteria bacterium]|nr:hypothetical protein [Deltaproteobacteria bacterium]
MTRRAQLDPALSTRVVATRTLVYERPGDAADDRPDHVRAASGLAMQGSRLIVIQDDASFLAEVTTTGVSAVKLPRGLHGRRRFEVSLGNKLDKLDLESCVAIDDELWAFGSGSLPIRDKICIVRDAIPRVRDAAPLFDRIRDLLGGAVNIEGAARVREELWLFHRGNTGPDDLGPAVIRFALPAMRTWLAAEGAMPAILSIEGYDLGEIDGVRLGFTDAICEGDSRVFYLATAERTPNAIDDGVIVGSQLGVITAGSVRAATLASPEGTPVKAEGIALDPKRPTHAWVALDCDDPDQPALLYDVELVGPWR